MLSIKHRLIVFLTISCVTLPLLAQDVDDVLVDGIPLENTIVGRDYAFRLRGEIRVSTDDDELIDEDTSYASFPAEMYTGEIMMRRSDKTSVSAMYSMWQNQQDLDVRRWGWKMRAPFAKKYTFAIKHQHWNWGNDVERDYLYCSIDTSLPGGLYSFSQYRLKSDNGNLKENQLQQYLNWTITTKTRVGAQFAISDKANSNISNPWYAQLFASYYLKPGASSISLDARYYDDGNELSFQDFDIFLYQKITDKCWARLMSRYYIDENDLSSTAVGGRLKYYFSGQLAIHAGYRWYQHSEDLDYDTLDAGFSLIF